VLGDRVACLTIEDVVQSRQASSFVTQTLEERIYKTFGLGFDLELSTRPEKSIGSDAQWEVATKGLEAIPEWSPPS
jgi:threonyl-tRNA synthetase